nr:MAG TPA: DNA gyrase inhibitor [Caudoviricetes sp.]
MTQKKKPTFMSTSSNRSACNKSYKVCEPFCSERFLCTKANSWG